MRILVCPDKFKGSLPAHIAAQAMADGLLSANSGLIIDQAPMADGGDGTVDAFLAAMGGQKIKQIILGPLGQPTASFFGLLADGQTGIIEMAAASGLALLAPSERNPMHTGSYGTGQLIRAALEAGCKKLIIGIGGSATNEGGMGMLQALGMAFYDQSGALIAGGTAADMLRVARVDSAGLLPLLAGAEIQVACDVGNPLCGPQGASAIFGPQKGADTGMILLLDAGLSNFADCLYRDLGRDIASAPGAGAAGGMGGALLALGARLMMGSDIVIDAAGLKERAMAADLILTGEGATDHSTPFGKVPVAMAALARENGIRCICLSGSVLDGYKPVYGLGVDAVFSIINRPMTLRQAMDNAYELLRDTAENIARAMGL